MAPLKINGRIIKIGFQRTRDMHRMGWPIDERSLGMNCRDKQRAIINIVMILLTRLTIQSINPDAWVGDGIEIRENQRTTMNYFIIIV